MALQHEFEIFKNIEEVIFTKESRKKMVKVDDFLILYIIDSLGWIPSYSKNFVHKSMGFDYYGRTYLDIEGITTLNSIVGGWIQLFEQAPAIIELTMDYDMDKGRFNKEKVEKENILNQLQKLSALCKKAIENEYILVHFGI
ncbi:hypothetical protein UAY_00997 [Enterococcus moraviensis ATCC BAA-383]|uniref:Uncharacterized protein n=1 Tax=Enterococcus moraviensis ATCC BAA-383 TaxID=1158609 RepID=R2R1X3_9ENTE|nr:hypothetical protein [Enterococcus moraviensis]EOI01591.1 hypothetical protein UAY_00997 [Enterococcus moraviensis ATCC BAA-383]EOT73874.1 hypothetical protein I586_00870 [Enterococcus moraviensis ATCC BAA-383]OJG64733.1 hypothetical protein RV09_GL001395 [Enterococcus moraviensis]